MRDKEEVPSRCLGTVSFQQGHVAQCQVIEESASQESHVLGRPARMERPKLICRLYRAAATWLCRSQIDDCQADL
jgi:hypothetical protein